ncbi:hypothetical protein ASA1KI_27840 [Opitutales bacterium ASA1]|uniref:hypothetical protein n=1 Tax=Congregicoccus parvus TaxID=3081749 RepID=UPI002B2A2FF3|nr:hypothetical protein ASA1KI_27840 [Opitutales bacterium ASA1]
MHRRILVSTTVLGLGVVVTLWTIHTWTRTAPTETPLERTAPPIRSATSTGSDSPPPQVRVHERDDPGRSPLADPLGATDGTIAGDMRVLEDVLSNYRLALGANPWGANAEIVAQLSGSNRRAHAPLPADHHAIDSEGRLLDRWGTPFFFHALDARTMEVRSAGPDRELYTPDDVVHTPGADRRPD